MKKLAVNISDQAFTVTIIAAVIILLILSATEVSLHLTGHQDAAITTVTAYGIPAIIGFVIGVPLTKPS